MKTTEYIAFIIDRLPKGYIFTYNDFTQQVKNVRAEQKTRPLGKEAVIKALNRMVASGKIAKLSKGKYYKPKDTVFGKLQPDQFQVVRDLLEDNGKVTGYLTGYSIFNRLQLTTQVSNTIQIGKNQIRPSFKRGYYTISFIKQKNTITKENIPLLQILDSIRYIKIIPDSSIEFVGKRLLSIIKNLNVKNRTALVKLALKYPPAVRALLGAILDNLGNTNLTEPLLKSLNPISGYKFPGIDKVLNSNSGTGKSTNNKNNSNSKNGNSSVSSSTSNSSTISSSSPCNNITAKWNIK
jgi:hypothetical protein